MTSIDKPSESVELLTREILKTVEEKINNYLNSSELSPTDGLWMIAKINASLILGATGCISSIKKNREKAQKVTLRAIEKMIKAVNND